MHNLPGYLQPVEFIKRFKSYSSWECIEMAQFFVYHPLRVKGIVLFDGESILLIQNLLSVVDLAP
jgi:hypothetical protein